MTEVCKLMGHWALLDLPIVTYSIKFFDAIPNVSTQCFINREQYKTYKTKPCREHSSITCLLLGINNDTNLFENKNSWVFCMMRLFLIDGSFPGPYN